MSDQSSPDNLAAFAAGLGEVSLLPDEALVQALADASATGARAWPDLQVPAEPFFRQLGRCLRQVPGHRPHLIRQLALGDLYLATGCLLGQRTALAHLETTHLKAVPQFIAHLEASKDFGDEVGQAVRHKLLLARPGEDARLAQYQAQGPLLTGSPSSPSARRSTCCAPGTGHRSSTTTRWSGASPTPPISSWRWPGTGCGVPSNRRCGPRCRS